MSGLAERYLLLALRLGRHVDGLVDAYYGPRELGEEAAGEPLVPAEALAEEADALAAAVAASPWPAARSAWLLEQVRALRTLAGLRAGERLDYADEVERRYGVRPAHTSEEAFTAAHEVLDGLLPGPGTLAERVEAFRDANRVPRERLLEATEAIRAIVRRRTAAIVSLPDGERFEVELVEDRPWAAYNWYLGGLRSRIEVNTDVPTSAVDLADTVAHESYPGHHTERIVKEAGLLRARGLLEESIVLVGAPQALVSEGIAEHGAELVVDDAAEEIGAALGALGLRYDAELAPAFLRARRALRPVGTNAALLLHVDGRSVADVEEYVRRWALASPVRARASVRFASDPQWRAYVVTYAEGLRLCRAWVGGDLARLGRLLSEQVTAAELRAAAGEAAPASAPAG